MAHLTRRAFLGRVSVITASGIVWNGAGAAASPAGQPDAADAPEPRIAFPKSPRDRIAVSSYPFRAFINTHSGRNRGNNAPNVQKMDLTDFPAMVAKAFSVSHIEPNSRHFMSTDAAYLNRFNAALAKAAVKVANIAVDGSGSFYDPDPAVRSGAIAYAKHWVDVAVQVRSPSIRAHVSASRHSDPNVDRAAASLEEVADYGARQNVVINLENDDPKSEDAFFIVKVIEAVNHPYLRALPDFANSMLNGDADFNYRALTAMFQHAYCICHVKDGEDDDNGKLLTIDIKKSFDILKASGYRGFCSMEFDAAGDPYAATHKLIDQTLKYLA